MKYASKQPSKESNQTQATLLSFFVVKCCFGLLLVALLAAPGCSWLLLAALLAAPGCSWLLLFWAPGATLKTRFREGVFEPLENGPIWGAFGYFLVHWRRPAWSPGPFFRVPRKWRGIRAFFASRIMASTVTHGYPFLFKFYSFLFKLLIL